MSEIRKRISIKSNGPLPIYGGIMGPIRTPFYETIPNISSLISSGADVYEHVNGKTIKLTMLNFDKDFTAAQAKVTAPKVVDEAKVQEATKQYNGNKNNQNQNFNKNKNKNNQNQQHQQAPQQEVVEEPVVEQQATPDEIVAE